MIAMSFYNINATPIAYASPDYEYVIKIVAYYPHTITVTKLNLTHDGDTKWFLDSTGAITTVWETTTPDLTEPVNDVHFNWMSEDQPSTKVDLSGAAGTPPVRQELKHVSTVEGYVYVWYRVPQTSKLQINIYNDPTTESWALDKGDIDINDWPVSKDFIDAWSPSSSAVALQTYYEIGKMEFDIYNWRWPTGVPRIINPATSYNASSPGFDQQAVQAWAFRRALAYLTNKPRYITNYLKGYGYAMETMVPMPASAGWTDYASLTNASATDVMHLPNGDVTVTGYIYTYNPTKAAELLDAANFTKLGGESNLIRNDPLNPGHDLASLKFYIRIDDPNRRQAGEDLAAEMTAQGIPVNKIITERSVCFYQVMVLHDYSIYTGGWSLTSNIDYIYDLYNSKMSGYAYDNNYYWFRNTEFDYWSAKVKFAPDIDSLKFAAIQAQWLEAKYIPVIELWAAKGVKAYRKGWEGVVNMDGFGTDNIWSFMRMVWIDGAGTSRTGPDDTIVYGFKSDISALHIISSEWLWDWSALGLMYDSLVGGNPYNLADRVPGNALASGWTISQWTRSGLPCTKITYTLRTDAKFHDGSPVTPDDVRFSLMFTEACGSGVAWNYAAAMNIDHIDLSGNDIIVYFNVLSVFALDWGSLPIINAKLWRQVASKQSWGLHESGSDTGYTLTIDHPELVRNYHQWTDDVYNAGGGSGGDGIIDLKQDLAGPWVFVSYTVGETIVLQRFSDYYLNHAYVERFINSAFHYVGDVNYPSGYGAIQTPVWYTADTKIDLTDLTLIGKSSGTNNGMAWGPGWNQYNPDTDLDKNNVVNVLDLFTAGKSFGKTAG